MQKYGNKKFVADGKKWDSKREYNRYKELVLLEKSGKITELELQKTFLLVPTQYEKLPNGKKGKCLERAVKYKADFSYLENGTHIVEDTKGFKTKDYIIKRKLMLWVHNIKIVEV